MSRSELTPEYRREIEAGYTFERIVGMGQDPIRCSFEVEHLKEPNCRIFQDLPDTDFHKVTPCDMRSPFAQGLEWIKRRGLSTVGALETLRLNGKSWRLKPMALME